MFTTIWSIELPVLWLTQNNAFSKSFSEFHLMQLTVRLPGTDLERAAPQHVSPYFCRDRGCPLLFLHRQEPPYFCWETAPDCVWAPWRRRFKSVCVPPPIENSWSAPGYVKPWISHCAVEANTFKWYKYPHVYRKHLQIIIQSLKFKYHLS